MSKMSELSQVLDEMIACGEGMIKATNAIKDIFSSTEETPEKTETMPTKKSNKAPETAKAEEAPEPIYTKEDVRAVLASKSAAGYKKIILRPLMVVAGDHANNDMAGEDEDSWKSMFIASGKFDSIDSQITGLGSIRAIQELYVAHTAAAMNE